MMEITVDVAPQEVQDLGGSSQALSDAHLQLIEARCPLVEGIEGIEGSLRLVVEICLRSVEPKGWPKSRNL
jgi:hypothetical protein